MKVFVLGNFGYSNNQIDGQTVKTRNVYDLFRLNLNDQVSFVDLSETKENKFIFLKVISNLILCKNLIYLPGRNNLKFIFPIIFLLSFILRFKINYFVIGGWLPEFLIKHKLHAKFLKRINAVFCETKNMELKLIDWLSFKNIVIIPNFRLSSFKPQNINSSDCLKIVFMSRIIMEKGIDSIFRFAEYVSKYKPDFKFSINFHGQIGPNLDKYFFEEIKKHTNITFNGFTEPKDVHLILSSYDVLVLPTRYKGEGFPGAIIDAYIAGLPVVVSKWKDIPSFVDEGVTGYIYNLENEKEFYDYLIKIGENKNLLNQLKINALEKSYQYSAEKSWEKIISVISNLHPSKTQIDK